jgi:tRNA (cytidine/uridine-2'-O-)-methyltransferase
MTRIALYQPDIAGNVGSIIRTVACLGGELHIIEPCGFAFDEQKIKRAAMDYFDKIKLIRHDSFADFYKNEVTQTNSRIVLSTTKADKTYDKFQFLENDILLFGKESAGVPDDVFNKSDEKIKIMMQDNIRSLNLSVSVAIIMAHFKISTN